MRYAWPICGLLFFSLTSTAMGEGALEPVGAAVEEPVLVDRWGIEHLWSPELTTTPEGKSRAVVVVFLDVNCPIVTRQAPTLRNLHERYYSSGVQLLGIYSNDGLTRMEMAGHKQKLDLPFRSTLR